MCFEQQVGSDCRLHLVRGAVREAGLRMLADIRIGPSVESAFLNADQIIGWQQITEAISFLHQGAHSSVLDLVFYEGDQFPPEYKGQAFVALKGSWNRTEPTGYKVVRVPFTNGRPEGFYENFATGFWISGERRAEVWGRPAALAVAKDGSLLVADDTGGTIWRISYTGKRDGTTTGSDGTKNDAK